MMNGSLGTALKIALFVTTSTVCLAQPFASIGRELKFTYAGPAAGLTDADLRPVLADATKIFKDKECKNDIGCDYTLTLKSPTKNYVYLTRVSSELEIIAIQNATGANVIIADRIAPSLCSNSTDPAFGPGRITLGCAPLGRGTWIAIVRDLPIMSVVLAHELGHAAGLPHRTALCALMHPFYDPRHRGLDSWECAQLHNPNTNPSRPSRRDRKKPVHSAALKRQENLRGVLVSGNMRRSQEIGR